MLSVFAPRVIAASLLAAVVACSSASSGSGTGGCASLATCCGTLSGEQATSCSAALASFSGNDVACADQLTVLQADGECGGVVVSKGSGTDTGGGGCSALTTCCPNLPVYEDPAGCDTVAAGGTEEACNESLSTYQASGYCGTAVATGTTDSYGAFTCSPACDASQVCVVFSSSVASCQTLPTSCAETPTCTCVTSSYQGCHATECAESAAGAIAIGCP